MFYPAGGSTYNLNSSISSTATSLTLTSFTVPVSGDNITMSLMNTDIAYATIAPKTTSSEFISFTTITQNGDGTATISGITRGLSKVYPFTEDSDYKLPHSGQSQFILSDAPQLFEEYGTLENDEVITGYWEAPDPITDQGLVTNAYMLNLINGGTISLGSLVETGTAGETLVAGNLIYFSETENEWMKCDADTLATVFNVKLGIAMGAGVNGGAITNGVLTRGSYTTSGLTQGDLIYASNTAGAFSSTVGTTPRVIGIAKSTTVLYFDPDFQNRLYNYAVDAVGTDAYAITLAGAFSAYYPGMTVSFKVATANTGACTLAVNGLAAKSIKKAVSSDLSTGDILASQIITVVYDGTNFQIISSIPANAPVVNTYNVADSPATWTKPSRLKYVTVQLWGGGGSGASQNTNGGGGGGGAYNTITIQASSLGSTETVTIGAGGAAATNNDGNVGGNSSFGSHMTVYGGGGGAAGNGGGGGGIAAVGSSAGTGGAMNGGAVGSGSVGGSSNFGGAGGGGGAFAGGTSTYGGGGGGGANAGNGGVGGAAYYGGGGGGAGNSSSTAGGTSVYGGAGGTGGDASPIPTAGVVPAGGGGGSVDTAVASGAGGAGRVIVTEFF